MDNLQCQMYQIGKVKYTEVLSHIYSPCVIFHSLGKFHETPVRMQRYNFMRRQGFLLPQR